MNIVVWGKSRGPLHTERDTVSQRTFLSVLLSKGWYRANLKHQIIAASSFFFQETGTGQLKDQLISTFVCFSTTETFARHSFGDHTCIFLLWVSYISDLSLLLNPGLSFPWPTPRVAWFLVFLRSAPFSLCPESKILNCYLFFRTPTYLRAILSLGIPSHNSCGISSMFCWP